MTLIKTSRYEISAVNIQMCWVKVLHSNHLILWVCGTDNSQKGTQEEATVRCRQQAIKQKHN